MESPIISSWFLRALIYILGVDCAFGEMAAPTIGAHGGVPMMPEPTAAPPRELVKARLQQRATATTAVYCDEWNIVGDYGRPKCYPGYTCLFTQIGGKGYEGCGKQGVAYNWITECWESKLGSAPVSQTYCTSGTAPYCGYFAFIVSPQSTYWNFGCSSEPYSLTVNLVDSTKPPPTQSTSFTSSGGLIPGPTVISSSSSPSTPTPPPITVEPKDKSVPIGAIVGGAAGGIGVLACLAALGFFLFRKKRKVRVQNAVMQTHHQQQQADAATATAYFATQQSVAEIEGKPTIVQHQPPRNSYRPPEKVAPSETTQEVSRLQSPATSFNHSEQRSNVTSSPPPVYTQPSSPLRPLSGFSELEQYQQSHHERTVSVGGGDMGHVRPMSGFTELEQHTPHHNRSQTLSSIPANPSTPSPPSHPPPAVTEPAENRSTQHQDYAQPHPTLPINELATNRSTQPRGNASELDSQTQNIPIGITELPTQRMYQAYSPPPSSNQIPTLSSVPPASTPPAGNHTIYQAYSPPPTEQQINASTGGITRPRDGVARTMRPRIDMSGAPMSEDYLDDTHERRGG